VLYVDLHFSELVMKDNVLDRVSAWAGKPILAFEAWCEVHRSLESLIQSLEPQVEQVYRESRFFQQGTLSNRFTLTGLFLHEHRFSSNRNSDELRTAESNQDQASVSVTVCAETFSRYSEGSQDLEKSLHAELASIDIQHDVPQLCAVFASNDRQTLFDAAKHVQELQRLLAAAQDFMGGFPFDTRVLRDSVEALHRVSSDLSIDFRAWGLLKVASVKSRLEAIRLAQWIASLSSGEQSDRNKFRLKTDEQDAEIHETLTGKRILESELTEVRPCREWRILLCYPENRSNITLISASQFRERILGKKGSLIDAVPAGHGKYRIRTAHLHLEAQSRVQRNTIVLDWKARKKIRF
jgi:hypothetical protein